MIVIIRIIFERERERERREREREREMERGDKYVNFMLLVTIIANTIKKSKKHDCIPPRPCMAAFSSALKYSGD